MSADELLVLINELPPGYRMVFNLNILRCSNNFLYCNPKFD